MVPPAGTRSISVCRLAEPSCSRRILTLWLRIRRPRPGAWWPKKGACVPSAGCPGPSIRSPSRHRDPTPRPLQRRRRSHSAQTQFTRRRPISSRRAQAAPWHQGCCSSQSCHCWATCSPQAASPKACQAPASKGPRAAAAVVSTNRRDRPPPAERVNAHRPRSRPAAVRHVRDHDSGPSLVGRPGAHSRN